MPNQSPDLFSTDFDTPPEKPLRSPRFWVGQAVAVPLCLAVALAYLLINQD